MDEYKTEIEFMRKLASEAGAIIDERFRALSVEAELKSDKSFVTETDQEVNQLVIDRVAEAFPGDAVLAEEGSSITESSRYWVCDPIDGTSGFIVGSPTGLFSLAFVEDGEASAAIVADPYLQRTFWAVKGGGAFMNQNKLRVSDRGLDGARMGQSSSVVEIAKTSDYADHFRGLGASFHPYSGVVHQCMNVALGRLDVRVYNGPMAHDVAASSLIVTEAGGIATDRSGRPLRLDDTIDGAIISNGQFHDQIIAAIDEFDVRPKTLRG